MLYRKDLEKQEKGTTGVKKVRRKSQFPSLNPLNMDCVFRTLVYTKTKFPSYKTTINSVCLYDVPTQLRCSQLQGLTNFFSLSAEIERQISMETILSKSILPCNTPILKTSDTAIRCNLQFTYISSPN